MKQSHSLPDKTNIDGERFVQGSYLKLFIRFLRYGLLAWGGPIAQLALIEREMVHQEKLISVGYFNRLIAIYQAFPGPETHEICVHLGTQAKGLSGGLIAGLGFMMPGFILMMIFSWLYVLYGITTLATSLLLGIKPAVIAWIIRGGIQLGKGILVSPLLWLIALVAFFAEFLNVHFLILFLGAGSVYTLLIKLKHTCTLTVCVHFATKHKLVICILLSIFLLTCAYVLFAMSNAAIPQMLYTGSALSTFIFGLKCGSLSFGSVYTILSIIKTEAIMKAQWLTQSQFIDGLALAGSLPAPFIIVTTFVGYLAYGFWGGILATIGTFLVPFLIPMFGYKYLNHIATNETIRTFLDGVTAAVAGLIAADIVDILGQVVISKLTLVILIISLAILYVYKSPYAIICIVLAGALLSVIVSYALTA